jgi:hypothetical protein
MPRTSRTQTDRVNAYDGRATDANVRARINVRFLWTGYLRNLYIPQTKVAGMGLISFSTGWAELVAGMRDRLSCRVVSYRQPLESSQEPADAKP